jgi:hypothetical protein
MFRGRPTLNLNDKKIIAKSYNKNNLKKTTRVRRPSQDGGAKKQIRKHKGINQKTGRLNKGYKYSGKVSKTGLKIIIKK